MTSEKKIYLRTGDKETVCLNSILMFIGAIGTNIVPRDFFGIPKRFSVFVATGYNAVLGIYLFRGFKGGDIK